ncbi:unnamed protein product [Kluyveromyces dobzhanskii CBS 2104]|uniref:DNA-directed RNA polymerase subunit n=1 Tax=Kluyveromyces dobzhanskii CBS 2104 TaxID=1427455 RepID=A0A0A8LAW6_9SACH|nr:unnamed protein product [Kluyveromyces dobzhanskii CBS 2104]
MKRSPEETRALRLIKRFKKSNKNPVDQEDGCSKCIVKIPVSMYVSLAPIYQQLPKEGIMRQHLNGMVMKYNADVGGVILGYENVSILGEQANEDDEKLMKLTADTPFAFTWCNVDIIVWQPQVGDIIEGWIFIQSASHIGLLIHDAFNASIKKNSIPYDWTFIHNEESTENEQDSTDDKKFQSLGHWVDGNGQQLGGKLKFKVKSVYTTGRMVSLEGTLLDDSARPSHSEVENLPVVSNKKIVFDDEVSKENTDSHKELELSVVREDNGDEIVYEKDSSESDSSESE